MLPFGSAKRALELIPRSGQQKGRVGCLGVGLPFSTTLNLHLPPRAIARATFSYPRLEPAGIPVEGGAGQLLFQVKALSLHLLDPSGFAGASGLRRDNNFFDLSNTFFYIPIHHFIFTFTFTTSPYTWCSQTTLQSAEKGPAGAKTGQPRNCNRLGGASRNQGCNHAA